jgi:hypothetical protein
MSLGIIHETDKDIEAKLIDTKTASTLHQMQEMIEKDRLRGGLHEHVPKSATTTTTTTTNTVIEFTKEDFKDLLKKERERFKTDRSFIFTGPLPWETPTTTTTTTTQPEVIELPANMRSRYNIEDFSLQVDEHRHVLQWKKASNTDKERYASIADKKIVFWEELPPTILGINPPSTEADSDDELVDPDNPPPLIPASPVNQQGYGRQLRFSSLAMGKEYEIKEDAAVEFKEEASLEVSRAFWNARYPPMSVRDVLEIEAAKFHYRGWWCQDCAWYYNYPTTLCDHAWATIEDVD